MIYIVQCSRYCEHYQDGECEKGVTAYDEFVGDYHCPDFKLKKEENKLDEKIINAFKNCIDKPKCKNCPWEDCEEFNQEKVVIPRTLADALKELLEKMTD